jgi:hypothetical protein
VGTDHFCRLCISFKRKKALDNALNIKSRKKNVVSELFSSPSEDVGIFSVSLFFTSLTVCNNGKAKEE